MPETNCPPCAYPKPDLTNWENFKVRDGHLLLLRWPPAEDSEGGILLPQHAETRVEQAQEKAWIIGVPADLENRYEEGDTVLFAEHSVTGISAMSTAFYAEGRGCPNVCYINEKDVIGRFPWIVREPVA